MRSLEGVSSALVARNESWVRQQAASLMRRVPSNVEKADLIQAGLIAVAQAAQAFRWTGDADSEAGREAFVRYAKQRVRGAMLDELRQMDHLVRSDRRKHKALQIARERWLSLHGRHATLGELEAVTSLPMDEIARLDAAALAAHTESLSEDDDAPDHAPRAEPATPADEVEARVDTELVLRRLAGVFEQLPERERRVIDAYLGIGLTPGELAGIMNLSPSRITQLYRSAVRHLALRLGLPDPRAGGRPATAAAADPMAPRWGAAVERSLTAPLVVDEHTRWG